MVLEIDDDNSSTNITIIEPNVLEIKSLETFENSQLLLQALIGIENFQTM